MRQVSYAIRQMPNETLTPVPPELTVDELAAVVELLGGTHTFGESLPTSERQLDDEATNLPMTALRHFTDAIGLGSIDVALRIVGISRRTYERRDTLTMTESDRLVRAATAVARIMQLLPNLWAAWLRDCPAKDSDYASDVPRIVLLETQYGERCLWLAALRHATAIFAKRPATSQAKKRKAAR
jgi:uncharacterized protein (DUF2384 family)